MNMWLMYLILRLDNIHAFFVLLCSVGATIGIVGAAALFVAFLYYNAEEDWKFKEKFFIPAKKLYIKIVVATFLLCIVGIFIPSTKQVAMIYFVPKVLTNHQIRKMPNKLVTLANDWMDEQIKNIKKADK